MFEDFDLKQKITIPKKMDNEESKHIATIYNLQRELEIIEGKLSGAINRYKIFTGELPPLKYYKYPED